MIKGLSTGKTSGYDRIDTEHIKFGGPIIVTIITKIFYHNRSITTAIFPEVLKFGLLIPIYPRQDGCHDKGIEVTCEMQGAGKQNVSSLHTNFIMREAIHYAK